nr:hypothetical protein [Kiritimatiellia bacterium]
MHIVRAGWGSRAEKGHTPTSEWHKYSVKWTINAGDSSWFFLRIDKDKSDSTVEFADMSLKWYPGAGAGDIDLEFETFDPFEKAKSEGWQGVPDKNLIYNPDFELGGTGYFYDFSWPKILAHYQKVITAKPTLILEGKGVDGGTCAELNGSGLRAFCFPVVEGETYTVSADLKAPSGNGKGTCSFMAFDMAWQAALYTSAGNIPADQWKRYSWTKTWTKKNQEGKGYVLFSGDKILIDRIQVVVGTEKEYQAPPIMVGLVFDQQQYFIRGRDAVKAQLNIVPGEKRSGTADVSAVVKDAWGKEVWKKSL